MRIIFNVLLPILMLSTFRWIQPREARQQVFFGKEQTTALKGFAAIAVYVHHFSQYISSYDFTQYWVYSAILGTIAVGIFYMIAGYTAIVTLQKDCSFRGFFVKRAVRLYMPLTILMLQTSHFLCGILWMYFFSWAAVRWGKPKYQAVMILAANVSFILVCKMIGMEPFWYSKIMSYSIGVFVAMYKNEWNMCMKRLEGAFWGIFSMLLLAFAAMVYGMFTGRIEGALKATTPFVLLSALITLLMMTRFTWKSKLLTFAGRYSWELFLLHPANAGLLLAYIPWQPAALIGAFAMTMVEAYWLQKLWNNKCMPKLLNIGKKL